MKKKLSNQKNYLISKRKMGIRPSIAFKDKTAYNRKLEKTKINSEKD